VQGVFEAVVETRADNETVAESDWSVSVGRLADMSRINAYGHAGDCMANIDRSLERFCVCA
jgi:hypothetical protein